MAIKSYNLHVNTCQFFYLAVSGIVLTVLLLLRPIQDKKVGRSTGKRNGRQLFACKEGHGEVVDLDDLLPKDFQAAGTTPGKKTLDKQDPIQSRGDESYARSMSGDYRASGKVLFLDVCVFNMITFSQ